MSIIVFIIVLSILIAVHEFGHFIAAKRGGVKVEIFALGFGPKLIGVKRGDTEYRISCIPLGGYVKMAGESCADKPTGAKWEFLSKSAGERFRIIVSGPLLNYVLGFIIFSLVFMIGIPIPRNVNRIGSLIEDYPAFQSGLKAGDTVIAVDGEAVKNWEEMVALIHKKTEGALSLTVKRGQKRLNISITPKVEKKVILGGGKKIALIGIRPEYDLEKHGVFRSVKMGGRKLFELTYFTFRALGWMVAGRLSLKEMTGPVGIFFMTGEMATLGFVHLLDFIGLISASLAIFNILPIPVLDGGHLLFLGIEKIRGKKVSFKAQEAASQIGFFILVMLMIFVLYSDFIKFGVVDKIVKFFK